MCFLTSYCPSTCNSLMVVRSSTSNVSRISTQQDSTVAQHTSQHAESSALNINLLRIILLEVSILQCSLSECSCHQVVSLVISTAAISHVNCRHLSVPHRHDDDGFPGYASNFRLEPFSPSYQNDHKDIAHPSIFSSFLLTTRTIAIFFNISSSNSPTPQPISSHDRTNIKTSRRTTPQSTTQTTIRLMRPINLRLLIFDLPLRPLIILLRHWRTLIRRLRSRGVVCWLRILLLLLLWLGLGRWVVRVGMLLGSVVVLGEVLRCVGIGVHGRGRCLGVGVPGRVGVLLCHCLEGDGAVLCLGRW